MEVRYQEQAVMQLEVYWRYGQHDAGDATKRKYGDKSEEPQHRRRKTDATFVHGGDPGKYQHRCRYGDSRCHYPKKGVYIRARAHSKEVVQPYRERKQRDADHSQYIGCVAGQRFPAKRRNNLRKYPIRRQHQNIYLGVSPHPNKVGVHHWVTAQRGSEKMRAKIAVKKY